MLGSTGQEEVEEEEEDTAWGSTAGSLPRLHHGQQGILYVYFKLFS